MRFPTVGQTLRIGGATYRVAEHPAVSGFPYGQEGRQGTVYRLEAAEGAGYALKVFKQWHRRPYLVAFGTQIAPFAGVAGLEVCDRAVLTPQHNPDLIREVPELLYAVLMPWISGPTWMEVMLERRPLTPEQSLTLARNLVAVLTDMEQRGLAHCDLSGANLLLPGLLPSPATDCAVALVDVEQLYGPGIDRPEALPGGSPGYAHRQAGEGLWGPSADRFAGAILVAELLGWCDDRVRQSAGGESYFDPGELQGGPAGAGGDRLRLLLDVLQSRWGGQVAALLERAWGSEQPSDCATFGEWLLALPRTVPVRPAPEPPPAAVTVAPAPAPVMQPHERSAAAGPVTAASAGRLAQLQFLPAAGGIHAVAPSPDGQWVAGGLANGLIRLWSLSDGAAAAGDLAGHSDTVTCLAYNEDGALLASGGLDQTVRLWEGGSGRPLAVLRGHRQRITGLVWSPEGDALVTASGDGTVRIWRLTDGAQTLQIAAHAAGVLGVAASPEAMLLATGGHDGLKLWRLPAGLPGKAPRIPPGVVSSVAFSPDGLYLAAGTGDGTVRVWETAELRPVATMTGARSQVRSLLFHPGGDLLLAAAGHAIHLWRVRNGAALATLRGHTNTVEGLALCADGLVAACSYEGIRRWGSRK